ncbi:hypothetical protein D3C73_994870 [compost metagenome]
MLSSTLVTSAGTGFLPLSRSRKHSRLIPHTALLTTFLSKAIRIFGRSGISAASMMLVPPFTRVAETKFNGFAPGVPSDGPVPSPLSANTGAAAGHTSRSSSARQMVILLAAY